MPHLSTRIPSTDRSAQRVSMLLSSDSGSIRSTLFKATTTGTSPNCLIWRIESFVCSEEKREEVICVLETNWFHRSQKWPLLLLVLHHTHLVIDTVLQGNHKNNNIGDARSSGSNTSKRGVPRSVQESDGGVVEVNDASHDILSNTADFR